MKHESGSWQREGLKCQVCKEFIPYVNEAVAARVQRIQRVQRETFAEEFIGSSLERKNGDVLGIFQYWCHQRYTCYRQVLDFQHGIILTPNGVARILGSPTRAEDHLSPRQERFEHQNHTTTVDITSLYPTLTPDYDSIYLRTSDLEIPLCNNSPSKTPRKQKD